MQLDFEAIADEVLTGVRHLTRRLRQVRLQDEMASAEREAMSRLWQVGSATSAELARAEGISPQAMGVTLAGLESRAFIARGRDPLDGRRVVLSLTKEGKEFVRGSRGKRTQLVAAVLAEEFTVAEIKRLVAAAPLLDRLAQRL